MVDQIIWVWNIKVLHYPVAEILSVEILSVWKKNPVPFHYFTKCWILNKKHICIHKTTKKLKAVNTLSSILAWSQCKWVNYKNWFVFQLEAKIFWINVELCLTLNITRVITYTKSVLWMQMVKLPKFKGTEWEFYRNFVTTIQFLYLLNWKLTGKNTFWSFVWQNVY